MKKSTEIFMGVAIKSGRGNVKGSDIRYPTPYPHIVPQILVLEKRLSVKKQDFFIFHIFLAIRG